MNSSRKKYLLISLRVRYEYYCRVCRTERSNVSWISHHSTWPAVVSCNSDIPGGLETFQALLERPGVSPISGPRLPMTPLYKSLHGTALFFLVSLRFCSPPQLPLSTIFDRIITTCSSTDLIKPYTRSVPAGYQMFSIHSLQSSDDKFVLSTTSPRIQRVKDCLVKSVIGFYQYYRTNQSPRSRLLISVYKQTRVSLSYLSYQHC